MIQFTQLRLSGFKSFVDTTLFPIEPGLTGIVGPNGCGKSNLVEALRWVMGEASAKKMRGGEMDDVIFGGTNERPARNIAEVSLLLDNGERSAPAAYNDRTEIEVARRIERAAGSQFRVNGRETRARDVQILFADAASGPRSASIVSQGRVAAIIAAKPEERRGLLEEAAGITGLHARRHEAELRLNGAETNLQRLDDVRAALDTQLGALKRQARQASRYRNLSGHIRAAEAGLLLRRWQEASHERELAQAELEAAERAVEEKTRAASRLRVEEAAAMEGLPERRAQEAASGAALHRLQVERETLEQEDKRLAAALAETNARLEQIASDIAREEALARDAAAALARLDAEAAEIEASQAGLEERRLAAERILAQQAQTLEQAEAALAQHTQRRLAAEADEAVRRRESAELADKRIKLAARAARNAEECETLIAAIARFTAQEEGLRQALAESEATSAGAQGACDEAHLILAQAREAEARARQTLADNAAAHEKLAAERTALDDILAGEARTQARPILDAIQAPEALAGALGAALGDDLAAGNDSTAPIHWRDMPALTGAPSLPAGAVALAQLIAAPAVLTRRLAQIGLVESDREGERLLPELKVGQRLVSRDGALWRWDGFAMRSGAPNAAATRLRQRNRLQALGPLLEEAATRLAQAEADCAERAAELSEAIERERRAQDTLRAAFAELDSRRRAYGEVAPKLASDRSLHEGLRQAGLALEQEMAEIAQRLDLLNEVAFVEDAPDANRTPELQSAMEAARESWLAAHNEHERTRHASGALGERRARLEDERRSWSERASGAGHHLTELGLRRTSLSHEQVRLAASPAELALRRQRLDESIAEAESTRAAHAHTLAENEARLAAATRDLREADAAMAGAREDRLRAESKRQHCDDVCRGLTERMADRLSCGPDDLLAIAGVKDAGELGPQDSLAQRLDRLVRERDTMGPVNLRAESEADELEAKIATIDSEKADLLSAIAALRRAIGDLNREGRERLVASFEIVNGHFQNLFQRLFGGGRAHLALDNLEDPLESGLEIYASPPGKRLQHLSLLSGGEQALTALSLLFAVFLTHPAPICVLDEVDAPLDDANVDRFCSLLGEIAQASNTRFLVITHHRLTMARMDRLFGVTMVERGVSQLVSVELAAAQVHAQPRAAE